MSRTFVLEPCDLSIAQAQKHGKTVYLFDKNEARSSIWDSEFQQEIRDALAYHKFDSAKDYFVIVGRMVPIVIAITTLVKMFGTVRVLFYSATERTYIVRSVG